MLLPLKRFCNEVYKFLTMKTLKLFMLIFISTAIFTLYSCTKDDQESIFSSELSFYPEQDMKGRLLFNDMSHFQSFMEEFEGVSLERLQEINKELGFISSYDIRLEKEQELGYQLTSEIIEDNKFASILSVENEIAFKDGMIYQANHDFCFWLQESAYDEIEEFRDAYSTGSVELIKDIPLDYSHHLKVARTVQEIAKPETLKGKGKGSESWDSQHRLDGDSKKVNYLIYKYIRSLSHSQKKKFFGWFGFDTSPISVSGNATITYTDGLLFPIVINHAWHEVRATESKVTKTLDYFVGITGFGLPDVEGTSTHSATWKGTTLTFNTTFD